jgi:hypothetical protein
MKRSAPRRIVTILVLIAVLLPTSAIHAAPLHEPAPIPRLLAWLQDTLAALWTAGVDEGGGLDPSGLPGTSSADEGSGLDPSGR